MQKNILNKVNVPILKFSQTQVVWALVGISFLVYLCSWIISTTHYHSTVIELSALHTALEVGGVILSFLTAFWIYKLDLINRGPSFAKRIARTLIVISVFNAFHAVSEEGNNFVLFHVLATYFGGFLFMNVWLPEKSGKSKFSLSLNTVIVLTVLVCVFCLLFQDEVPSMIDNGQFTSIAIALQLIGGFFLIVSGVRFILIFLKTSKVDDLMIFIFCSLLGISALMFEQSTLWGPSWWSWHLVRFFAILVAFTFVIRTQLSVYNRITDSENYLKYYNENLEKGIDEKTKELKKKNSQLEQYTSIVSHDLQEPLKSIISLCEIVKSRHSSELTEKTEQIFGFIGQSASRMDNMVTELLKQGRIGYDSELRDVDCEQLLKEVLQDLNKTIEDRNAVIRFKNLPTIMAYPAELRMLFQNLISNAVKYTADNKQPKVSILCVEDEDAWLFSVEDNGIGIPEGDREKIFDLFSRLHGEKVYQGLGIGLSQCKRVVELHKGEIWVEPQTGEGSIFFFTIKKKIK